MPWAREDARERSAGRRARARTLSSSTRVTRARRVPHSACLFRVTSLSPPSYLPLTSHSTRLFPGGLSALAVSPLLSRAAVCAGEVVKVVSLGQGTDAANYKEVTVGQLSLDPSSTHR